MLRSLARRAREALALVLALAAIAAAPTALATNRALLIGVGDYLNDKEVPDLAGAVNDVVLMRQVLISRFGYAEDDIRVLTDTMRHGTASSPRSGTSWPARSPATGSTCITRVTARR